MPSCCSGREVVPEPQKHRVHFMIGRGGGGHIAAARAVKDCLVAKGVFWAEDIEMVDTGYLFDQIIAGRREARNGFDGDELYNWLMKRGQYQLAELLSPLGAMVIRAMSGRLSSGLEKFWREREPRAVVCFVPVSGTVLRGALLRACPTTPLITVVTDMSSTSGHKWLDPYDAEWSMNHTIIAGSEVLQSQASSLGYPACNVVNTSGMIVHPRFYADQRGAEQTSNRHATGVIFFGGQAPMRVEAIARSALTTLPDLDLVVICGGNTKLLARMQELAHPRCIVEGFLPPEQIRDHMRSASFVIGKPGPGVVAEAMVCGVPYVTELSRPMSQEQSVLDFLASTGVGVLLPNLEALPADLLQRCAAARETVAVSQRNRAVFEVAEELVAQCLPLPSQDGRGSGDQGCDSRSEASSWQRQGLPVHGAVTSGRLSQDVGG